MSRLLLATLALLVGEVPAWGQGPATPRRPNIVLIIADDMGHGDLGFHGNPIIRTPHLDRLARQSVRLTRFYVSPVCSPTRASLLTGRYNYRTGIVDTFLGRSLMHPDEVTLAELLAAAGYRTGIFGKWHLGDNYPLRAIDQGFHEALVHKGGGIGQPSDPPGGSSYFDPVLQHNGKEVQIKGYCSDVFTDAAINFIAKNKDAPFFIYLPFNCPHTPLQVPDNYYALYKNTNLEHDQFPKKRHPLPGKAPQDITAKVYGMVTNLDDNVGRLLAKLDELKLSDNTIVIFLTDNGPQQVRYNSGMLMRKGSVHEGGVRVPFVFRWPARFPGNRDIDRIAAHIDVVPTLLVACDLKQPKNLRIDGLNLMPLLQALPIDWPDRSLFVQWHRGDVPELYRAFAVRTQDWRLVQPDGVQEKPAKLRFKLYHMTDDPREERDIADKHPDIVARMKRDYEAWFKDVSATRGYTPPRIHLGAPQENPTVLTRQDWRGPRAGWKPNDLGHWEVHIAQSGVYDFLLTLPTPAKAGTVHLQLGKTTLKRPVGAGSLQVAFDGVAVDAGPARLEAWLAEGNTTRGMLYVQGKRRQ
jgi:arylsulfatase A-like enzyme